MRVNIFSGGRRIAIVSAVIVASASGFFAWLASEPSAHLSYSVDGLGRAQLDESTCSFAEDGSEYIYRTTSTGQSVSVTLCFKAQRASDGRMLVPYKVESDGSMWLNTPYSPDVKARITSFAAQFQLPIADDGKANSLFEESQRAQFTNTALAAAAGAFIIWLLTFIIGWIVRGFLGVPRGQDFRPADGSSTSATQ